ncbi:HK97 family phage prohead protease [Aurantibacillus circumpalustris]|uniref:HK97 family phage prohead protease n=1 Tax=Aurantibacillus circumpalustris TaxID=3036359 RepID=UPI00295B53F2|nr:HK97 family phage prohead protease [Aurantibacillus circumpalustris]
MAKKTFILSDETKNQYGFIVQTSGIGLSRFKQNPVMLNGHATGLDSVIGMWDDVRAEGVKLLAETHFDEEDVTAKEIARKVDKGFIKGASIWVDFKIEDVKLNADGVPVITKCELMEASIVSVPNNKNSVKLCASGVELKDDSLALKLSTSNINTQINTMKELALIYAALGLTLTANSTPEHAAEAINALKAERDANKTKVSEFETKLAAEQDAKVTALIDGAITSKKLTAENKDKFTKLAKLDFESTKSILEGMSAHTTIASQLNADKGGEGKDANNPFEGKNFKELMATTEGSQYLLKLKAAKDPIHKKLWEAAFPNGTYND